MKKVRTGTHVEDAVDVVVEDMVDGAATKVEVDAGEEQKRFHLQGACTDKRNRMMMKAMTRTLSFCWIN
jgi:Flp pilus assembly protein TadB